MKQPLYSLKSFFIIALAMVTIGSLSACSKTEQTTESTAPPAQEAATNASNTTVGNTASLPPQQAAANNAANANMANTAENPAVGNVAERPGNVSERPVARNVMSVENLQPGKQLTYYLQQFKQMGYRIQKVDNSQSGRVVYYLNRDNKNYKVSLIEPAGSKDVQKIETKEVSGMGETASATKDMVSNHLASLSPGKNPVDYVPAIDKWGKVTEYKLHKDHADVNLEANNKNYKITMDIDPANQTVTRFKLSG